MFLLDSCTMNGMTSTEWKRVAAAVVARRTELGMKTAKELAERAQLTPRVIGDVENARRTNYGAGTKAQIEHALGWVPGSIDLVLQGKQPLSEEATENAFKFDKTGRRARLGYQDAAADRILKLYLSAVGLTQLIRQEPATPQSVRDFADSLAEEILKVLGETVGPDALRALSAGFLRFADIAENHSDDNEEGADHDTIQPAADTADRSPAARTPGDADEGKKTPPQVLPVSHTQTGKPDDLSTRRARRKASNHDLTSINDQREVEYVERIYASAHWPDGVEVDASGTADEYRAWIDAGSPDNWRIYRERRNAGLPAAALDYGPEDEGELERERRLQDEQGEESQDGDE